MRRYSFTFFLAFPANPMVGTTTGDMLDSWSATYLNATDNWTGAGGTSVGGSPYGSATINITAVHDVMGKQLPTGTADFTIISMKMPAPPPVTVHVTFGP